MNKLAKQVVEYAKERGFTHQVTGGNHIKLTRAGCKPVFIACTPSDQRAVKNNISIINRIIKEAQV